MRRFWMVLVLSVLIVSLVLGCAAFAHEIVLKPSSMTAAKGETIQIELHSLHRYIVAEEMEDVSWIKAGMFRNGALVESELRPNEPELRIDFDVKIEDDGAVLAVAAREGMIWSITNEGGMRGSRRELEARNLKVTRATKIDKYAKVILNASKDDKNYATQIGQDLEVVPVTNPADAKVGEFFEVKILLKGQAAALPVWATYHGFVLDIDDTYAYYTESGADGSAKIKITAPGLWIVRTVGGEPGVEGEYDARNLRSILTFEVK